MDSQVAAQRVFLAVAAIFKNESQALKEWLDHYIAEGAEHFYLIDDGSTDNFQSILAPYEAAGLVTLYSSAGWSNYLGRQRDIYNRFILPLVASGKAQWFLVVDLDEFAWSPAGPTLTSLLKQVLHLGQVQMNVTIFGSNHRIFQPPSIIAGFTRRSAEVNTPSPACYKYFVNSDYRFTSLNVHHATFENDADEKSKFQLLQDPYLRLNHYSCQSREFWEKVKLTRGDCDAYLQRTEDHWRLADQNAVEDLGLLQRRRGLVPNKS